MQFEIQTSKWIYTVTQRSNESNDNCCTWCGGELINKFYTNADFIDMCCGLDCLLSFHKSLDDSASFVDSNAQVPARTGYKKLIWPK
jgi:hypothetical protein